MSVALSHVTTAAMHGPIEDAKLLADYQTAVRSASAKTQ
jgi:hypothetical protein